MAAGKGRGVKRGRRKLSKEEFETRRTARRMEGLKAWETELKFRDRLAKWKAEEFVRDQFG